MRAGPSVCLKPSGAIAFLAALSLAFTAWLGAPAWTAAEIIQAQDDVEQPAEVAPDEDELDPEGDLDQELIEPKLFDRGAPKTLDRSFMRPDLKGGSEDEVPPHSVEESKQDKLVPLPDDLPLPTPVERPKVLGELYDQLAKAHDAEEAAPIAAAIENLWRNTGSPTVDLLMSRAVHFTKSDLDLALRILDATIDMAPDEAEVWYLRAKVHYLQRQYELALIDLRRALDRDPKHYRALEDLGLVFEALGTKKDALEAYRKALAINPFLPDADQAVQFLSREVGGRDI
jgi:tetratricopeptide (TPR) repeat protein